jgi:ketosteroid isomerase-like protein
MNARYETDEAAIRQQVDVLVEAIRSGDLEGLKPLYAADIVSFDVQPPLQHVGIAAKLDNWVDVFTTYRIPLGYEVRDLVAVVGDGVAYGHSLNRLSGTLKNGTATNGVWVRWTGCFQKINGTWLIAHDQVSTPLDFQTGKAVLDLEP